MKAFFKPTQYQFEMKDEIFVSITCYNGAERILGAFEFIDDAQIFARAKMANIAVKGVLIFTRTSQIDSIWKA